MDNRAYILDLLSRGAAPADVARTAGVHPSYISQLSRDPIFAQELSEKRALHAAERSSRAQKVQKIHDSYLEIEETLLRNLGNQAKANLLKPIEQLKLLQVVAGKKEPASQVHDPATAGGQVSQITTISLPSVLAAKFILNERKEIIGTEDGMSFMPMSGNRLKEFSGEQEVKALEERAPKNPEMIPQVHRTDEILALFSPEGIPENEIQF